MFSFPDSEYKWCPQCAGNIRREAQFCRFCKNAIENKLLKERLAEPACILNDVAQWLPSFNSLVMKCSDEFQARFRKADEDLPAGKVGVPHGVDPEEYRRQNREIPECPNQPPEPQVAGLLLDILMSIYECGESLAPICDFPKLQLIEVTPQEVIAECELRKEEMQKGSKCQYCAEYKFPEDDECRFCEGTRDKRPIPTRSFPEKPVDRLLLKDVLLYEAAWSTICGVDPPFKEILERNGIDQESIDREILRQRSPNATLPMTRFCKRIVELGLTSYFTPESMSVSALVDLGSALDNKKLGRADEALIVYNHALKRTDENEELMYDRGHVLTYIALLYQGKEDYENYRKFNEMAEQCRTYGMSDEMKALMSDTRQRMLQDFEFDADPEKRLAQLMDGLGITDESMKEFNEQIDATIPGFGELFSGLSDKLSDQMHSTRLNLEGQVAEKNSDYALAESKYLEALAGCSNNWMGGGQRPLLLCSLARVKHLQGDNEAAEAFLKESLQCAEEYVEARPEFGRHYLWSVYAAYAWFLCAVGRYEQSENYFKNALQVQKENIEELLERYGGDSAQYSRQTADIKKDYAKLLRAAGRDDEASALDQEVTQLEREAEAAESKAKERRLNFKKEVGDDSSGDPS